MDKQQIAIKLIMDDLGWSFSMKEFKDRLVLQKAIYLIQEAGFNLGYHFSWYLKGPYSSRLASDGFCIQNELHYGQDESQEYAIEPNSKKPIDRIRSFFQERNEQLSLKLELLASVHFLVKKKKITGENRISDTLQKCGKPFTPEQVATALQELSQNGLLS